MKKNSKLTLLLGLCVGVLIFAFFAMVIYPKYSDLSAKADEATKAQNKAKAQLKAARALDEDDINTRLANLQARIPSSLELPNVILRLDELATSNNLIWLQGTPEDVSVTQNGEVVDPGQSATEAPQLDRYDFSIVVRGTMTDFLKFVHGMTDQSIGRIIVITALDVQFNAQDGPEAIEATLKLEVIGWKDGATIDSSGCITSDGTVRESTVDDPNCNRTNVESTES